MDTSLRPRSRPQNSNRPAASAAIVAACVLAACSNGVAPAPATTISGQAVIAGSSIAGVGELKLTLASETSTAGVTTPIAADGRFEIAIPHDIADATTISATIDAPARRVFRPVLLAGPLDSIRRWLERPLLVPRAVSLASTSFGGDAHVVNLVQAFLPPCPNLTDVNCDSFFPQRWLTSVALWPEASLPVPVAFDHVKSRGPIAAADSAALWAIIAKMQLDLGRTVFRPATLPAGVTADSAGYVVDMVVLSVDSSLIGVGGDTEWIWNSADDVTAAKVRVRISGSFGSSLIVTHELMHALGFVHTCAWPSVMGGYGCGVSYGVTIDDAAAFTLAYDVRRAIVTRAPTTALGDARRGETQIEGSAAAAVAVAAVRR